MSRKQVKVKIKRDPSSDIGDCHPCQIASLENSGTVNIGSRYFRVGDCISDKDADSLCSQNYLQVVIQLTN